MPIVHKRKENEPHVEIWCKWENNKLCIYVISIVITQITPLCNTWMLQGGTPSSLMDTICYNGICQMTGKLQVMRYSSTHASWEVYFPDWGCYNRLIFTWQTSQTSHYNTKVSSNGGQINHGMSAVWQSHCPYIKTDGFNPLPAGRYTSKVEDGKLQAGSSLRWTCIICC